MTSELIINGGPYHKSATQTKIAYENSSLSEYLREEATSSAGDYVLGDFDGEDALYVFSPGFSGGYVTDSNNNKIHRDLCDALAEIPSSSIKLDPIITRRYINKNLSMRTPITTPFCGITSLLPACYYEMTNGKIQNRMFYGDLGSSNSFETAIKSTAQKLKNTNKSINVMYSGGADSTALLLALKQELGDVATGITIDRGPSSNSGHRAVSTGNRLNLDIKLIESKTYEDQAKELVLKNAKKNFVPFNSPSWFIISSGVTDILLSGQNFDAAIKIGMRHNQTGTNLPLDINIKKLIKYIATNVQFMDHYSESQILQLIYALLIPTIFTDVSGDSSKFGHNAGILSTRHPNIIKEAEQNSIIDEVKKMHKFKNVNGRSSKKMNFLGYQANASSTGGNISHRVFLHHPAMWGPIMTYGFKKKRGVKEVIDPKKEVYAYINEVSKMNFRRAYKKSAKDMPRNESYNYPKYRLGKTILREKKGVFEETVQAVIDYLPNDAENCIEDLDHINELVNEQKIGDLSNKTISSAHRILNLGLIIEETA